MADSAFIKDVNKMKNKNNNHIKRGDQSWNKRQKYQIYHFKINHFHSVILIDDAHTPNCYAIKKSWKVKKWIIINNKSIGRVVLVYAFGRWDHQQREEEQQKKYINKYKTKTKTKTMEKMAKQ